jgi:hypothetical protein
MGRVTIALPNPNFVIRQGKRISSFFERKRYVISCPLQKDPFSSCSLQLSVQDPIPGVVCSALDPENKLTRSSMIKKKRVEKKLCHWTTDKKIFDFLCPVSKQ